MNDEEEIKRKIVRMIVYLTPIIIIALLVISSIIKIKRRSNQEEEKSPIMEVSTEEQPMSFDEEVNNAVLYLENLEDKVTVKTNNFEYFKNSKTEVKGKNITQYGKNDIIEECLDCLDNHVTFNGLYSIYADNLENCLFRIIPEKKRAEKNRYQFMGMEFEHVSMTVGSAGCEEVDIQYKKAIYIVNQTGMFYIRVKLNDYEDIERLGFTDMSIIGRVIPYSSETKDTNSDDKVVNIACYITENGFEFYADQPLAKILVDKNSSNINEWQTIGYENIDNFIYDAKDFTFKTNDISTNTDAE